MFVKQNKERPWVMKKVVNIYQLKDFSKSSNNTKGKRNIFSGQSVKKWVYFVFIYCDICYCKQPEPAAHLEENFTKGRKVAIEA